MVRSEVARSELAAARLAGRSTEITVHGFYGARSSHIMISVRGKRCSSSSAPQALKDSRGMRRSRSRRARATCWRRPSAPTPSPRASRRRRTRPGRRRGRASPPRSAVLVWRKAARALDVERRTPPSSRAPWRCHRLWRAAPPSATAGSARDSRECMNAPPPRFWLAQPRAGRCRGVPGMAREPGEAVGGAAEALGLARDEEAADDGGAVGGDALVDEDAAEGAALPAGSGLGRHVLISSKVPVAVSPSNGGRPRRSSYKSTPSPHQSAANISAGACSSSGGAYSSRFRTA